ncbi:CPBP family intramembrane metalloprotease [Paenibacillus sp. UMB7766-LJ446]|uniref:CPBP family intramembrane glutamic endopeptidase n=1 Tax=Paenibacillus sp. UMB7766-LJ446 TaxID=3046313 RepID=UPI00254AF5B3|nr:CPBP family intramembrane glutamic endopeptidase [Paenibacillus sp. UMB7766-LJ446]MDK8189783.1 CPBP family intramembrane metalloprotease [Paenibacillus sp. UMB7766-LJ446]
MTETKAKEPYKILLRVSLTLTTFLFIGLVLIWIVKRGEMLPFIASLFIPNEISILSAIFIGLITSLFITTIVLITFIKTRTELPQTEGSDMVKKIMIRPSGIAVSAIGGGFFEEFFFRGVLIGLFIGYSLIVDWLVILISTFLFWVIHVPQYKGAVGILTGVFVNGLIFALLFYFTGSLIPPMLAHGIYNTSIGIILAKKYKK